MDKESREKFISKLSFVIFKDITVTVFDYYCNDHTDEELEELEESMDTQREIAEMVLLMNKLSEQIQED